MIGLFRILEKEIDRLFYSKDSIKSFANPWESNNDFVLLSFVYVYYRETMGNPQGNVGKP